VIELKRLVLTGLDEIDAIKPVDKGAGDKQAKKEPPS
jgi:hypothetical protein